MDFDCCIEKFASEWDQAWRQCWPPEAPKLSKGQKRRKNRAHFRARSAMNPPPITHFVTNTVNQKVALDRLDREDRARYRSLPDPFCRYCKHRKPCGC